MSRLFPAFLFLSIILQAATAPAISSIREMVIGPGKSGSEPATVYPLSLPSAPRPTKTETWKIGVYLPVAGAYREIGQRLRRGLRLALKSEAEIQPEMWRLLIVDSTAVEPARALVLFRKNQVVLVLGPLQSRLADASVNQAIALNLPIMLWAPRPELCARNRLIFQHFLSAANQGRALAELLRQGEEKKIALLYPENDFGRDFRASLIANLGPEQTHSLVRESFYDPHSVDFSSAIKLLQTLESQSAFPQSFFNHTVQLRPDYPFSALVIADFYPRLRLLAPQLRFFGLEQCRIYGIIGGHPPRRAGENGKALEGTVFLDFCGNLTPAPPRSQNYRDLYQTHYGETASIYDLYAYDSILILQQARQNLNQGKACDLPQALLSLPVMELAGGQTQISADGEFSKKLCPAVFQFSKPPPKNRIDFLGAPQD
ncbi:MAG TPA: amino acid ABC transporter substrate-binding protein [Proteobacteria bacterium]|nr:amino acid ABC transporter substrate-binding protein [Pseudomonadota bacterium]